MKPEWKDVTSYSRDDKERIPTTFAISVGELRIVITCGHIYYRPDWVMHCHALQIDSKLLQAVSREEAQTEAILVVKAAIARLTANYLQIKGTLK